MDWLNPLNRLAIMTAVRDRKKKVTLLDGRVMSLTYRETRDGPGVLIRSSWPRAFAPRGEFTLARILSLDFNDE